MCLSVRLSCILEVFCYGNLGPPKILVLGTKFSGKISPGGPILPENFDPCPKILVLPFACACAFSTSVESRCCKVFRKLLGWKDLRMLRVIMLAKCSSIFSVRGKYCDGASKERKRTIRKKALKFSVSSRGELFYRQKRKGKACSANMCSSCKHFIWNPFLVNTQVDCMGLQLQMGNDVADKADNSADEMGDDAAQTPCSVADNADNSADGSIIEISNHTVDTVLYLPVCRDWQSNMCSLSK